MTENETTQKDEDKLDKILNSINSLTCSHNNVIEEIKSTKKILKL